MTSGALITTELVYIIFLHELQCGNCLRRREMTLVLLVCHHAVSCADCIMFLVAAANNNNFAKCATFFALPLVTVLMYSFMKCHCCEHAHEIQLQIVLQFILHTYFLRINKVFPTLFPSVLPMILWQYCRRFGSITIGVTRDALFGVGHTLESVFV